MKQRCANTRDVHGEGCQILPKDLAQLENCTFKRVFFRNYIKLHCVCYSNINYLKKVKKMIRG